MKLCGLPGDVYRLAGLAGRQCGKIRPPARKSEAVRSQSLRGAR
jgi:hypothetical protein